MPFVGGFRAVGFTQSKRRYPAFIEDLPAGGVASDLVVLRDGSQDLTGTWDVGDQDIVNIKELAVGVATAAERVQLGTFLEPNAFRMDDLLGHIGLGAAALTSPRLYIKAAGGAGMPVISGVDFVIGGSGLFSSTGMAITANSSGSSFIDFGDQVLQSPGQIGYAHSGDTFSFKAGGVFGTVTIAPNQMFIGSGGAFGGRLSIDQGDATAAIAVLDLDQADLSEEFIQFTAAIGVGNPIEAVGAKTLTTTHFVFITLNGTLGRYIQVGTIA